MEVLWNHGRTKVWGWDIGPSLAVTIERDNTNTPDEAMLELFRKLRPNETGAHGKRTRIYIEHILRPRRYNLGRVGRYKINRRLQLDIANSERLLTVTDVVAIVKGLIRLRDGNEHMDDIDHLGNRRVRAVGELLQNQVRIGLLRMGAHRARTHDDDARPCDRDGEGPHQRPPDIRGAPRILRLGPALAVHGPDEPRSLSLRTAAASPRSALEAFRANAPDSKPATSTIRTTAVSAR